MSYRYFYHNELVHVLHPSTHRLFKRVDANWIELNHASDLRCFRLQAVELAPSEVGRYGLLHSESAAEGSLSGK
ncbi:MAG: hypothetical protein PVF97_10020 [Desulfobacterales bacterium]